MQMNAIKYLSVVAGACLALTGCYSHYIYNGGPNDGPAQPSRQKIVLTFPANMPAWKQVDQHVTSKGTKQSFIPPAEASEDWKQELEMITISYAQHPGITAQKSYDMQIANAKEHCKQMDSHIINSTPKAITYIENVVGCPSGGDQHLVGKIFNGVDGVYAVRYAALPGQVSSQDIETYTAIIKYAYLINK
jgi:hypothetical protein